MRENDTRDAQTARENSVCLRCYGECLVLQMASSRRQRTVNQQAVVGQLGQADERPERGVSMQANRGSQSEHDREDLQRSS